MAPLVEGMDPIIRGVEFPLDLRVSTVHFSLIPEEASDISWGRLPWLLVPKLTLETQLSLASPLFLPLNISAS